MKPSRELDALVAEKVIGYECVCDEALVDCPIHAYGDRDTLLPYSTDIAMALGLCDNMTIHKSSGRYHCIIKPEYGLGMEFLCSKGQAEAGTLPVAICLAALEAVGVEVEDAQR